MIRRLNGDYISYINNQKVCLTYLHGDLGTLEINNKLVGKCSYSYVKKAIEKIERKNYFQKTYLQDNDALYGELKVGTFINYRG
jgi:hypothetical protein